MVNKEEYCEQGLTEVMAFIYIYIYIYIKKKNLGNFNGENVIIPSVIVISEVYLSSVHILYTTALEIDYAIAVSMNIHAMAFKNFSSAKIEAA